MSRHTTTDSFIVERLFCVASFDMPQDLTRVIIYMLIDMVEEIVKASSSVPIQVIHFVYFEKGKADILELKIEDTNQRAEVYKFCDKMGIYCNTKWEVETTLRRCSVCLQYSKLARYNENGILQGAMCETCREPNSYIQRRIYETDEHYKETYEYRSTGEMLLRRFSEIPYKRDVSQGESFRKRKRQLWLTCK